MATGIGQIVMTSHPVYIERVVARKGCQLDQKFQMITTVNRGRASFPNPLFFYLARALTRNGNGDYVVSVYI